jgi:hypothetical protein
LSSEALARGEAMRSVRRSDSGFSPVTFGAVPAWFRAQAAAFFAGFLAVI